eukprot:1397886-Pleurochrysis_carterae.AAC.1
MDCVKFIVTKRGLGSITFDPFRHGALRPRDAPQPTSDSTSSSVAPMPDDVSSSSSSSAHDFTSSSSSSAHDSDSLSSSPAHDSYSPLSSQLSVADSLPPSPPGSERRSSEDSPEPWRHPDHASGRT